MDDTKSQELIQQEKQRNHRILDGAFVTAIGVIALRFSKPAELLEKLKTTIALFPSSHYTPQYDWTKNPMPPGIAATVWTAGMYFLIKTYGIERDVVQRAHKKYAAHNNKTAVRFHGVGSVLELTVGAFACANPDKIMYTKIACLLAINNIISGFALTPGVFGIKHLTVPGFAMFGVLRTLEVIRTLCYDYRNYPQAWIALQVGTIVRLLGYFVLPFTSTDARDTGDLFTEPSIYSFNILLSGYLTTAFLFKGQWNLMTLVVYALSQRFLPHNLKSRRGRIRERKKESEN